jgi:hypothetical protein
VLLARELAISLAMIMPLGDARAAPLVTSAPADKLFEEQEQGSDFDVGDTKYPWGQGAPLGSDRRATAPWLKSLSAPSSRVESIEKTARDDESGDQGTSGDQPDRSQGVSAPRADDATVTTNAPRPEQPSRSYPVGSIAADALALIFVVVASRGLWRRRKLPAAETDEALRPPSSSLPSLSTFGLHGRSTLDELEMAYSELARRLHPDRGGDAEKFKEMHLDYERAKRFLAGRDTRRRRAGNCRPATRN